MSRIQKILLYLCKPLRYKGLCVAKNLKNLWYFEKLSRKGETMKKMLITLLVLILFVEGCSVIMAGKKHTRKDTKVVIIGESRDIIVQTLGPPDMSATTESGSKDIYKIVESAGTGGSKFFAIAGHATMDVLTLGLWEIVGTPLELATQESPTSFILYYNKDYILQSYEAIK